jgi:uncharacterized membrane protein
MMNALTLILIIFGIALIICGWLPFLFNERAYEEAERSREKAWLAVIIALIPLPGAFKFSKTGAFFIGIGLIFLGAAVLLAYV